MVCCTTETSHLSKISYVFIDYIFVVSILLEYSHTHFYALSMAAFKMCGKVE